MSGMPEEKHYHTEHQHQQPADRAAHEEHQEGARHQARESRHEHDDHDHSAGAGGQLRVGILTCSDRSARGERADVGGPTVHNLVAERLGAKVAQYKVVPDDRAIIAATLREWADEHQLDLIITTGGTGFAPRDVTPEATRDAVERETPALVQAMVVESLRITPYAMLTRATAGIRGRTLIVNLPGNPKAATENFDAVAEVLPHAVQIVQGVDIHAKGHDGHGHAGGRDAEEVHAAAGEHGHAEHGYQEERAAPSAAGIARNVGGPPC